MCKDNKGKYIIIAATKVGSREVYFDCVRADGEREQDLRVKSSVRVWVCTNAINWTIVRLIIQVEPWRDP